MNLSRVPMLSVTRLTLRRIAAAVWATAGGILLARSVPWLMAAGWLSVVAGFLGLAVGILKSRLVFIPMAARNVERIRSLAPDKERICVFAFQGLRSYVMIVTMISLGILLRHSSVSRTILAGIYSAIGSALLMAVPRYLRAEPQGIRATEP